jgi:uncharacterized alkaline shock family protein YloU
MTTPDAQRVCAPAEAGDPVVERVAAVVAAVPGVASLHGGPFGDVATYLPGRRVTGVRLTARGDRVEVHVVAEYLPRLPDLAERVRMAVRAVLPCRVDVTIEDIRVPEPAPLRQAPCREEHQW